MPLFIYTRYTRRLLFGWLAPYIYTPYYIYCHAILLLIRYFQLIAINSYYAIRRGATISLRHYDIIVMSCLLLVYRQESTRYYCSSAATPRLTYLYIRHYFIIFIICLLLYYYKSIYIVRMRLQEHSICLHIILLLYIITIGYAIGHYASHYVCLRC